MKFMSSYAVSGFPRGILDGHCGKDNTGLAGPLRSDPAGLFRLFPHKIKVAMPGGTSCKTLNFLFLCNLYKLPLLRTHFNEAWTCFEVDALMFLLLKIK